MDHRYVERHWRMFKELDYASLDNIFYLRDFHSADDAEKLRELTGQEGPVFAIHPDMIDELPENVSRSFWRRGQRKAHSHGFSRNPFTLCSCSLCTVKDYQRRADKRGERQKWHREVDHALAEMDTVAA